MSFFICPPPSPPYFTPKKKPGGLIDCIQCPMSVPQIQFDPGLTVGIVCVCAWWCHFDKCICHSTFFLTNINHSSGGYSGSCLLWFAAMLIARQIFFQMLSLWWSNEICNLSKFFITLNLYLVFYLCVRVCVCVCVHEHVSLYWASASISKYRYLTVVIYSQCSLHY